MLRKKLVRARGESLVVQCTLNSCGADAVATARAPVQGFNCAISGDDSQNRPASFAWIKSEKTSLPPQAIGCVNVFQYH